MAGGRPWFVSKCERIREFLNEEESKMKKDVLGFYGFSESGSLRVFNDFENIEKNILQVVFDK